MNPTQLRPRACSLGIEEGESRARGEFLTWHLRMCVLANMRGLGKRVWYDGADGEEDSAGTLLEEDPSGAGEIRGMFTAINISNFIMSLDLSELSCTGPT